MAEVGWVTTPRLPLLVVCTNFQTRRIKQQNSTFFDPLRVISVVLIKKIKISKIIVSYTSFKCACICSIENYSFSSKSLFTFEISILHRGTVASRRYLSHYNCLLYLLSHYIIKRIEKSILYMKDIKKLKLSRFFIDSRSVTTQQNSCLFVKKN